MPSAFEFGSKKNSDHFACLFRPGLPSTKTHNVRVVVLPRQCRRFVVVAQCRSNTGMTVCCNRYPDPGTADQHPATDPPVFERGDKGLRHIRVIDRFRVMRSKIQHFITKRTNLFCNGLFQYKTAMVDGDTDQFF